MRAFMGVLLAQVACAQQDGEWVQHAEQAIYKHAGVSSAHYAVAGTSLTQPLEAELFDVFSGNQSFVSVADTNPQDHDTVFDVDIARSGTTAVALQSARGNFSSFVYKFTAVGGGVLDWTATYNRTELTQVKVSADGSVIALLGLGNMSFYEPPNVAVYLLDGDTGRERQEGFFAGEVGETNQGPGTLAISTDGSYVAFTSIITTGAGRTLKVHEYVHVIEVSTGKRHRHEVDDWSSDADKSDRFVAVSQDGVFLACGSSSTIQLLKRSGSGDAMEYQPFDQLSVAPGDAYFLDGAPALSFGGSTGGRTALAAGWLNVYHPKNGVLLSVWSLDEAAPAGSASTLLVNYSLPVDDDLGDSFQNVPAAVEVSPSGSYVALCSWGTEERLPGQEQLQLIEVPDVNNPVGNAPTVPVLIMTGGSMFSCAVADDGFGGAHLVGAGKAVHANQMGNGGDFYYVHHNPGATAVDPRMKLPKRLSTSAHSVRRSIGGKAGRNSVMESTRWQLAKQSQSVRLASVPSRSLSPDDPVVDLDLVAEINNISASTGVYWQAGANYERFGNMTRKQLQTTLLRTGPWSNAPASGARTGRGATNQKKPTDLGVAAHSRIPESFDARQQVLSPERCHAYVWPRSWLRSDLLLV
jgi:hypothetical protein